MANTCIVCRHEQRQQIEEDLFRGTPLRTIADQWSISKTSLIRHRGSGHIQQSLVKAGEATEVSRADSLLDHVQHIRDRALRILDEAAEDPRLGLMAIREIRGVLQLLGQVSGELPKPPERADPTTVVNIGQLVITPRADGAPVPLRVVNGLPAPEPTLP